MNKILIFSILLIISLTSCPENTEIPLFSMKIQRWPTFTKSNMQFLDYYDRSLRKKIYEIPVNSDGSTAWNPKTIPELHEINTSKILLDCKISNSNAKISFLRILGVLRDEPILGANSTPESLFSMGLNKYDKNQVLFIGFVYTDQNIIISGKCTKDNQDNLLESQISWRKGWNSAYLITDENATPKMSNSYDPFSDQDFPVGVTFYGLPGGGEFAPPDALQKLKGGLEFTILGLGKPYPYLSFLEK
jgi:hypothetical protein